MLLLYVVEGIVPILVFQIAWAARLAWRQDKERHKRIAAIHAASVWGSYVVSWILIYFGHTIPRKAPAWIIDTHLVIIYIIPVLLVFQMATGLKGIRPVHIGLAAFYLILWAAALVTGAMIFLSGRGYI
ncbi:MAG: hypothetical protein OEV92_03665 [Nitrospinota bacterium]|nr:hypothetical protein [Nitrospinota bacterium]